MKQARIRLIIAAFIVAASMVMTAFGVNHFTQSIGWLAAGFLFGQSNVSKE